jgi:hypothetical protein
VRGRRGLHAPRPTNPTWRRGLDGYGALWCPCVSRLQGSGIATVIAGPCGKVAAAAAAAGKQLRGVQAERFDALCSRVAVEQRDFLRERWERGTADAARYNFCDPRAERQMQASPLTYREADGRHIVFSCIDAGRSQCTCNFPLFMRNKNSTIRKTDDAARLTKKGRVVNNCNAATMPADCTHRILFANVGTAWPCPKWLPQMI